MAVWFEGVQEIDCTIGQVKGEIDNHGQLYVGVVGAMAGMTSVELVEQGSDSFTIKTNEGLMTRTNISKRIEEDRVVVESDERYEAGSKVTAKSHFYDEFTTSDTGVTHRLVISDVSAPGFLGFFYRRFGGSNMGKAYLQAYRAHFENQAE